MLLKIMEKQKVEPLKRRFIFRTWFYFRQGWSVYFAFIFAAINTLTVTYYLAIERIPDLQVIFPTFSQYIIIVILTGVPILVLIGYTHYKRSLAYQSEVAVGVESNPYVARNLVNSEIILEINLILIEIMLKTSKEKLTSDDIEKITKIYSELKNFTSERKFTNKDDIKYYKSKIK